MGRAKLLFFVVVIVFPPVILVLLTIDVSKIRHSALPFCAQQSVSVITRNAFLMHPTSLWYMSEAQSAVHETVQQYAT